MKTLNYTPSELNTAYQIVSDHLLHELIKTPEGKTIRLGTLGKFTKKARQTKMGWTQQTYLYYHLNFKPFTKLKTALDNSITKQYVH